MLSLAQNKGSSFGLNSPYVAIIALGRVVS